jgi:hypothetical protein
MNREYNVRIASPMPENCTVFSAANGDDILRLCNNGDIYVRGRLAETDSEVVNALRDFIKEQSQNDTRRI